MQTSGPGVAVVIDFVHASRHSTFATVGRHESLTQRQPAGALYNGVAGCCMFVASASGAIHCSDLVATCGIELAFFVPALGSTTRLVLLWVLAAAGATLAF